MPPDGAGGPSGAVPGWMAAMNIHSPEEAYKIAVVTAYCFTANTILLLGRNIGATMLLTGLGADALPYVMVLVGVFILFIMPLIARFVTAYSSNTVQTACTYGMIAILTTFLALFTSGVADAAPRVTYSLFFVLEEVIDSVLMVLFWQSARPHRPRAAARAPLCAAPATPCATRPRPSAAPHDATARPARSRHGVLHCR
jgi:hypothetical protein